MKFERSVLLLFVSWRFEKYFCIEWFPSFGQSVRIFSFFSSSLLFSSNTSSSSVTDSRYHDVTQNCSVSLLCESRFVLNLF